MVDGGMSKPEAMVRLVLRCDSVEAVVQVVPRGRRAAQPKPKGRPKGSGGQWLTREEELEARA